jgi:hypothetical protein
LWFSVISCQFSAREEKTFNILWFTPTQDHSELGLQCALCPV